jgi:hypothetical protein
VKLVLIIQAILCILGTALLIKYAAARQAYSYFSGSALLFSSFLFYSIGWSLIFKKKLVALAVVIIVFKYAIFAIIIFSIVDQPWFAPLWFAAGVTTFIIPAISFAVSESLKEGTKNVI